MGMGAPKEASSMGYETGIPVGGLVNFRGPRHVRSPNGDRIEYGLTDQ